MCMHLHFLICMVINVYIGFSICVSILWPYVALCYVYEVKLKRHPLRELMFSKPLKLNLCMFTVFIIKPEVAGKSMMTHWSYWESCISHSYVPCRHQRILASDTMVIFIEFSVMHWHFDLVLNASVLTASSDRGLHVSQPPVPCTSHEPVFPSPWAVWWCHSGWCAFVFPPSELPH